MNFLYATVHAKFKYGPPKNSYKFALTTVLKFNKEEDGKDEIKT